MEAEQLLCVINEHSAVMTWMSIRTCDQSIQLGVIDQPLRSASSRGLRFDVTSEREQFLVREEVDVVG